MAGVPLSCARSAVPSADCVPAQGWATARQVCCPETVAPSVQRTALVLSRVEPGGPLRTSWKAGLRREGLVSSPALHVQSRRSRRPRVRCEIRGSRVAGRASDPDPHSQHPEGGFAGERHRPLHGGTSFSPHSGRPPSVARGGRHPPSRRGRMWGSPCHQIRRSTRKPAVVQPTRDSFTWVGACRPPTWGCSASWSAALPHPRRPRPLSYLKSASSRPHLV